MSSSITVWFDEDLSNLLLQVIDKTKISKSEFIRLAVQEKIEDILDLKIAEKSYFEWKDSGKETMSHETLKNYFDL